MAQAMTAVPAEATRCVALSPSVRVCAAPTARTLRRRRLMVLLAALTAAVLLVAAASRAAATLGGVPASAPERRPAPAISAAGSASDPARASTATYVVQPGDTLWSIARRLQPGASDLRPLVDRLVAMNHGPDLAVGQRISVP